MIEKYTPFTRLRKMNQPNSAANEPGIATARNAASTSSAQPWRSRRSRGSRAWPMNGETGGALRMAGSGAVVSAPTYSDIGVPALGREQARRAPLQEDDDQAEDRHLGEHRLQ